jgi:hypothetical protein
MRVIVVSLKKFGRAELTQWQLQNGSGSGAPERQTRRRRQIRMFDLQRIQGGDKFGAAVWSGDESDACVRANGQRNDERCDENYVRPEHALEGTRY